MMSKEERSRRLVAVDMPNGLTYIGELVEYLKRNPTKWLEKVIVVPSKEFHKWEQKNVILYYKEDYEEVADSDSSYLRNIPFNEGVAIAIWDLE